MKNESKQVYGRQKHFRNSSSSCMMKKGENDVNSNLGNRFLKCATRRLWECFHEIDDGGNGEFNQSLTIGTVEQTKQLCKPQS